MLSIGFLAPEIWVPRLLPRSFLGPRPSSQTHHALSSQEVRDHALVQVVHQAARALVIAAAVDEELPPGVLIDEGADLRAGPKL